MDVKNGTLNISGDFGCAVANWYGYMPPKKLAKIIRDPYYFFDKIACATDLTTRHDENLSFDLECLKEEKYGKNQSRQFLEDWYSFSYAVLNLAECQIENYPIGCPYSVTSFANEYGIQEDEIRVLGLRLHTRVRIWQQGFRRAVKSLGPEANYEETLKEVV